MINSNFYDMKNGGHSIFNAGMPECWMLDVRISMLIELIKVECWNARMPECLE